jgi:uncharacterized membrane protein YfcA
MSIATALVVVIIGLAIGAISGMIGIGGGVLVIPILMIGFGFSQAKANGTSMAMLLPPIGLLAVLSYSRAGNIEWRFASLLAVGFAAGAYLGAKVVNSGKINPTTLRVLFAMLLLYIAGRVLFRTGGRAMAALETSLLIIGFTATFTVMRLMGRRWERPRSNWATIYRQRQSVNSEHDYEI